MGYNTNLTKRQYSGTQSKESDKVGEEPRHLLSGLATAVFGLNPFENAWVHLEEIKVVNQAMFMR